MSRMMAICCALVLPTIVSADELLLPIPDPISSPTAIPCEDELIALDDAHNALFAATEQLNFAESDVQFAENELNACLAAGGNCSQEQADLDLANALATAAQENVDNKAGDVDDAQFAYEECMCMNGGGGGGGEPPEPEPVPPFPPAFAIMSDKGLPGVVNLVASQ